LIAIKAIKTTRTLSHTLRFIYTSAVIGFADLSRAYKKPPMYSSAIAS